MLARGPVGKTEAAAAPLILAVDDSPTIRKIVEVTLLKAHYRVKVAATGLEALAAVVEEPPSLIVLDIMLARLNGLQLCALIKRRYGHIPILLLTGKTSVDDKVNGWLAGCTGYITKPFEAQHLLEAVQRHLPGADAMDNGGTTDGSTDSGGGGQLDGTGDHGSRTPGPWLRGRYSRRRRAGAVDDRRHAAGPGGA